MNRWRQRLEGESEVSHGSGRRWPKKRVAGQGWGGAARVGEVKE